MSLLFRYLRQCKLNSVVCVFQLSLLLVFPPYAVLRDECTRIDACRCKFENGSLIDLTSLASTVGPRWRDLKPLRNESFQYYYNPCFDFDMGDGDCKNGVAVCQVKAIPKPEYHSCGEQSDAFFVMDSEKNQLILRYHSYNRRQTDVRLVCSVDAREEKLIVEGETSPMHYDMTLISICACPDQCGEGLSFGSELLIIFFLCVFLYLLLGIVYMHLVKGAHGWELIPHYEVWQDIPLLVRDGCVYVSSGCRRETSYERI